MRIFFWEHGELMLLVIKLLLLLFYFIETAILRYCNSNNIQLNSYWFKLQRDIKPAKRDLIKLGIVILYITVFLNNWRAFTPVEPPIIYFFLVIKMGVSLICEKRNKEIKVNAK